MRARRFAIVIALVGSALVVASCAPEFDNRTSKIDAPRILAVRSEPPDAKAGERVTITALYSDGVRRADGPLSYGFCLERRALAEPAPLDPRCLRGEPGAFAPLGGGGEVSGFVPIDACRLFGPDRPVAKEGESAGRPADPDSTGGYYQPGIVRGAAGAAGAFDVRVQCGVPGASPEVTAGFGARYVANQNPSFEELVAVRANGEAIPLSDRVEFAAARGEALTIRASWSACDAEGSCAGAERYVAYDSLARAVIPRREAIRVSWLGTGGDFDSDGEGRAEADLDRVVSGLWTAPKIEGDATLFVVLRDSRGGVAFRSAVVHVR